MSCSGTSDCNCGCCSGTAVETPKVESNPPGLSAISRRAGTWSNFKGSMLARLSSSDYPALADLKTRDDDDFTIAFLDASAIVLDILAFYQERLANESYLRTATQSRSLVELSRLIGYQPSPGVSAATYLAFTLKKSPGQVPDPAAPAITIPKGSQVQSVPAQGQTPQTFETSADILAKADWNALPVQTGLPWVPQMGDLGMYLMGTATQLQEGDLILIVGDERLASSASNNWDVRLLTKVQVDKQNARTYIAWTGGLGDAFAGVSPTQQHPKFYAFRQRAALFGYNAVNPKMLDVDHTKISDLLITGGSEWKYFRLDTTIDLDTSYPKIATGSWVLLIRPDNQSSRSPSGFLGLYLVTSVSPVSRSDFGLSSKITRIFPDLASNLGSFPLRQTTVFAQSDRLDVPEQPLDHPLYGALIDLHDLRPDVIGAQVVALFGKQQKIAVADGISGLQFIPDDGSDLLTLNPGDLLTLTSPAPLPINQDQSIPAWSSFTNLLTLNVEDAKGRAGTIQAHLNQFALAPWDKNDPDLSEYALVQSVNNLTSPVPHTQIQLQSVLTYCYNRNATSINANVGLATHGQSISEILGSGNASTPNQTFILKQSPLTFVQASTPTGGQSTLEVRANGVAWKEVPSLYKQDPSKQVFATLNRLGGAAQVLAGDGVEGATLPTGQNNIHANYRIGIGSAGNVRAGALTTLMDRPIGVSGVTNPEDATGGQDAQSLNDIRLNAPQTVLTLGRAVSITDYQSYATTFAGIVKAYALWIPSGPGRGVFLTVAGVNGAALPSGNPTLKNLVTSLQNYGNPLVPITVVSFLETLFSLSADLRYDPAYDQPTVKAQVLQTLSQTYSFANRTFGQGVSLDEVAAVIQGVPGVVAVNVTEIHTVATSAAGDLAGQSGTFTISKLNKWLAQTVSLPRLHSDPTRICPFLPVASPQSLPLPAEIMVLDPDPSEVVLGLMS